MCCADCAWMTCCSIKRSCTRCLALLSASTRITGRSSRPPRGRADASLGAEGGAPSPAHQPASGCTRRSETPVSRCGWPGRLTSGCRRSWLRPRGLRDSPGPILQVTVPAAQAQDLTLAHSEAQRGQTVAFQEITLPAKTCDVKVSNPQLFSSPTLPRIY